MLKTQRPLVIFEKGFIPCNERIQFAIEIENPSVVPKIIENLHNAMLGFDLRLEGDNVVYHKNDFVVHKIPTNIHSAREACNYVNTIPMSYDKTLSTIAANDKYVAVSVTHLLYDGGFFMNLYQNLLNEKIKPTSEISLLPTSTDEIFSRIYEKGVKIERWAQSAENITTAHWSKNMKCEQTKRKNNNDANDDNEDNTNCRYHDFETPVEDCQFIKSKFGLTDSYWTIIPLCLMAFEGKLQKFGIQTCVDLRPEIGKYINLYNEHHFDGYTKNNQLMNTINCNFSPIYLVLKDIEPDKTSKMTIRQIGSRFRDLYNQYMNDGMFFDAFGALGKAGFTLPEKNLVMPEVSNVGRFILEKPIVDCWIQQTVIHRFVPNSASFTVYSKTKYGKNTLVTRFQQPQSVLSNEDSHALASSVVFALKEISPDTSIQDAYEQIRKFQENSRKH
ncbi:hypothetical protein TRFO_24049 [Tritrichomonas foetus]|uniref:Condensation domain-containing protein n=1 Tax=Tritrichomonas foetus TaxID=1144522 RepID=A0A1J4KE16_9EUKA|nr:hypothetical protein TRFO_24049 [Tritrichomonas foetus]|eukprot:OHT07701.1 hypothetical protein TRFO_24049 [Tritrichomonas foetus]